ncbi:hypothetical protein [Aliivibrio wodanis]|uniref:hypothetical protein n=1 Tax=Aliivibrio wodanis TaxID=80852 RepID=UPI00406C602E
MKLANLAVFSSKKELKRHQKQFPCQYEHIIEEGDTFRRYHSMEPAILYGEWIKITNQLHSDLGRCVYIERLNENAWYGAAFDNGQLLYEYIEPFDMLMQTFAYDCHRVGSILSPTNADDFVAYAEKVVSVEPVEMAWMDSYQLAKIDNYLPVKIMGGIAALVVGLCVLAYLFMPMQKPEPKDTTSATVTEFLQSYSTKKVSASNALTNAIYLLAETSFLPPPTKGDAVTLVEAEKKLTLLVSKNNVRETLWTQWLNANETLSPLYDSSSTSFVFPLEYEPLLSPVSVDSYLASLLDAFYVLNIAVVKAPARPIGNIDVSQLELSMTGSISHLNVLRELIDSPVITATELTLTRLETNEFTLTLTIDIHGISNGN